LMEWVLKEMGMVPILAGRTIGKEHGGMI